MKKLYDLDYKESAIEFGKLARKYTNDFVIVAIYARAESDWQAAHYQITQKSGFSFPYSVGTGNFSKDEVRKAWQRTDWSPFTVDLKLAQHFASGTKKLLDKQKFDDFCFELAKVAKPNIANILSSSFMDAENSDQYFEDWADDLGYDPDSIKGKAIWEECNNIRRFLIKTIGAKDFEAMAILANQL